MVAPLATDINPSLVHGRFELPVGAVAHLLVHILTGHVVQGLEHVRIVLVLPGHLGWHPKMGPLDVCNLFIDCTFFKGRAVLGVVRLAGNACTGSFLRDLIGCRLDLVPFVVVDHTASHAQRLWAQGGIVGILGHALYLDGAGVVVLWKPGLLMRTRDRMYLTSVGSVIFFSLRRAVSLPAVRIQVSA